MTSPCSLEALTPASPEEVKGAKEHDASGQGPLNESDTSRSTKELLEHLNEHGFVILRNVLTGEKAGKARSRFAAELAQVIKNGELGRFAKINDRKFRHDLRLHMSKKNHYLLEEVINSSKNVSDLYKSVLEGTDASLVEFGVITSHPGAEPQSIHSDVTFDAEARRVYTTFVAIQNIDETMGPTHIWKGTHQAFFCEFYKPRMLGPNDPYYLQNKPECMIISAGDAVLMDTRVMHRGGPNKSEKDRMLWHFSFETTKQSNKPDGFTYNLMEDLKGKFKLKDFVRT